MLTASCLPHPLLEIHNHRMGLTEDDFKLCKRKISSYARVSAYQRYELNYPLLAELIDHAPTLFT